MRQKHLNISAHITLKFANLILFVPLKKKLILFMRIQWHQESMWTGLGENCHCKKESSFHPWSYWKCTYELLQEWKKPIAEHNNHIL